MSFTDSLLSRHRGLWARLVEHPFVLRTRDGDMPPEIFNTWLRQDYLFVREGRSFLGLLLARSPERLRDPLADALAALGEELDLFRDRAAALGVDLEDVRPGLVNHAFVQYLKATAHGASYGSAFTAYWTAEKAYHECWKVVEPGLPADSPRRPLVENWAGDEFAGFVGWLGSELDALAEQASAAEREAMEGHFERTARYELAFWEMALEGPGWPGLEG
ncbi:MAG: hypothetical protein Q8W44_10085 [Candidatus Palauibacterales bacterium]|nr:hypothetical protein [Candidatus Palauibacterales bacterium]